MCMVSAISGYGGQMWPHPQIPGTYPQPFYPGIGGGGAAHIPVYIPPVPHVETDDEKRMKIWWEHFKKALDAAKEFDKATGQPDCIEPAKEAWMAEVLKRLEALEAKP